MTEKENPQSKPRRWWLAALLSLSEPGLGQIYNGQALKGMIFLVIISVVLTIPVSILLVKCPVILTLALVSMLGLATLVAIIADAIVNSKKAGATYLLKPYNRVLIYFGIFVVFFLVSEAELWLVKKHIVQSYKIPSQSMAPTLLHGDAIIVDKLTSSKQYPNRNQIVVFEHPTDPTIEFVKRVVGIAGDVIEIKNKYLYINGQLEKDDYAVHLDDTIMPAQVIPRDNYGPTTVPEDAVFVMGDNRDHSLDSRFFGFVEKSKIRGVAKYIYFSWDRENTSVRWKRIGRQVK